MNDCVRLERFGIHHKMEKYHFDVTLYTYVYCATLVDAEAIEVGKIGGKSPI